LTITVLYLCDALSDEGTSLSFLYAAGPRQLSLSHLLFFQILDFRFRRLL
jgi:hypothetical protein